MADLPIEMPSFKWRVRFSPAFGIASKDPPWHPHAVNISDEIEKLGKLKADGLMSDEEFAQAKAKLIEPQAATPPPLVDSSAAVSKPVDVKQWAMIIHLSQLANFIVPMAGVVAPIVLWQMKKDESPIIDQHGKNVTNWLISCLIYAVICFVLVIVVIGAFMGIALAIVSIVFAILGGLKANNGEVWKYPMTIQFIK